jgi:hypothetical protein
MKLKPKSEMNMLLWSFTIPVLLLVALIVATYLVYGIVNVNDNAKQAKKLLVEQSTRSYKRFGENFRNMSSYSPELLNQFNPEIPRKVLSGDPTPLYALSKHIMTLTSPSEYVAVIKDGKIIDSISPSGTSVDPEGLPTTTPESGYAMLDSFNGEKGDFLDLFIPIDLSRLGAKATFTISAVIDLTEQIKKIDKYFQDQKRDTVITLVITGIIALILFGLLSTFWLRHLINKYIRKPVDKLNTMAKDIADGTYEGEVVVDENSDFAALQGLLKSGQLILQKFNEKMSGKD